MDGYNLVHVFCEYDISGIVTNYDGLYYVPSVSDDEQVESMLLDSFSKSTNIPKEELTGLWDWWYIEPKILG
jgi:hypothetical protein